MPDTTRRPAKNRLLKPVLLLLRASSSSVVCVCVDWLWQQSVCQSVPLVSKLLQ